jgi:AcrR family transcriptional regulator
MESGSRRSYQMRKRAEQVAQTRQRIVDAAVRLHTSIGPAHTTITRVAGEACVTRATVYSHFASDDELFAACTGQWVTEHPPPDLEPWIGMEDLQKRATGIFGDIYAWFSDNAHDLRLVNRDLDAMPGLVAQAQASLEQAMAQALLSGEPTFGARGRRLQAAAAHLVSFPTWDSLVSRGHLNHAEVVNLAVAFLRAAAD